MCQKLYCLLLIILLAKIKCIFYYFGKKGKVFLCKVAPLSLCVFYFFGKNENKKYFVFSTSLAKNGNVFFSKVASLPLAASDGACAHVSKLFHKLIFLLF